MFKAIDESHLNYILNIRQRYSEDIFGQHFRHLGGDMRAGTELKSFAIVEDGIIATLQDPTGRTNEIKSYVKLIIPFSEYLQTFYPASTSLEQMVDIP